MRYFDAHVIAPELFPNTIPSQLIGGILFGPSAVKRRREFARHAQLWCHAAPLTSLIEPPVEIYSGYEPTVIDLQLTDEKLSHYLQLPVEDWWPLAGTSRGKKRLLRLTLPAGAAPVASLRRIIRSYPQTLFIIDAFRHGPVSGWQAQVGLGEFANVRLTTVGMVPGVICRWTQAGEIREALHYAAGEVGAGKILYASGLPWNDGVALFNASNWLAGFNILDEDQQTLILEHNARELFIC